MTDRSTATAKAATWLATTPEAQKPHPLIPHLQLTFGLSLQEAIQAIRESQLIRARAT